MTSERFGYYCGPELHNGEHVPADYFVVPARAADLEREPRPSFAACAAHLPHAVETVQTAVEDHAVIVRKVTGVMS